MITTLAGGSGAILTVRDDILIKEDTARLHKQALKQIYFYDKCGSFKVPKILAVEKNGNKYSIVMEYIKNAVEISNDLSVKHFFVLGNFFNDTLLPNSVEATIEKSVFTEKLNSIILPKELHEKAEAVLASSGNTKYLFGPNHGDFTIKNILYDNENYYLIDFLDSFIESPLQDYSKLFQDIILNNLNISSYVDAVGLREKLNKYNDFINLSSLFNFLRMYPYLKDYSSKNKVSQIIMDQKWIIA